MDDKKKAIAALIVARQKPEGEMGEGREEEADGQLEACSEMISAIKSGDERSFKAALQAFLDQRD